MYAPGGATERGGGDQPQAVELHGLDASVSLAQLRHLFHQADAPVLQLIAALDTSGGSQQGVALAILGSERAARAAVELFDGYPLGNAFLHVKRADSLPGSLINLLYSLEQASRSSPTGSESRVNAAAAAVYMEQHQLLQRVEHRRQRQAQEAQQQAWDVAQQAQKQAAQQAQNQQNQQAASAVGWGSFDAMQRQQQAAAQQVGNGHSSANGHGHMMSTNGTSSGLPQQHHQVEADLRHLQLDQQHRAQQAQQQAQQQAAAAAAAAAAALPPPQPPPQQRTATMSWASAAAAAPSLAALAARPQTTAASLAAATVSSAAGSGSGLGSDDWQTASGSRGRTGRRGLSLGSESAGRAGSSVSSGSPAPANSSEDKLSRPGGQDGASPEPTTKLWMGGIDGTASAETVRGVFGRFGPIYDYELQPATHEKGRTDQWGFVNYKRLGDASRAYEALVGEVIPELTGTRKLKLQFRPVDTRRPGGRR